MRSGAVRMLAAAMVASSLGLAAAGADAEAAPTIRYGVQDDAWLENGPGTLASRLEELQTLGVEVVRYTLRWDEIASRRPGRASDPEDPAYDWRTADRVLRGLRRSRIAPLVTLYGSPAWANGGRPPNHAPRSRAAFAAFARAAATRYPWVTLWTIWNEPNQAIWLRPTSVRTYVRTLLNPAYEQIHAVVPGARVGGGMTAARGGSLGVAPVPWIRAMGAFGAKLDAYAHHPYPSTPRAESPWGPRCARCSTITMADLERLDREVQRNLGRKRIWVTEYGYQTNPPDTLLGVSPATQAAYMASASLRTYLARNVDILLFFLVRDDTETDGWQSGLLTARGQKKPAYTAFRLPVTQVSRAGPIVRIWGQIRPGSGRQPFRVRVVDVGGARWLGVTRRTNPRGFFEVSARLPPGTVVQVWAARDRSWSLPLRLS
jgi:hypothetical protein